MVRVRDEYFEACRPTQERKANRRWACQEDMGLSKVLIVGAGPTGALLANALRRELQQEVTIVMWDKSRGTGGRMSSSRSPDDPNCIADLGAQYITVTPEFAAKHASYYKELSEVGLIKSLAGKIEGIKGKYLNPDTENYVTPNGISSIVKHFIHKSEVSVKLEHHLSGVEVENVTTATSSPKLCASSRVASQMEGGFDAIVLTMPVPQILQQEGLTKRCIEQNPVLREELERVQFSSRFALGLFYAPDVRIDVPFVGKYVEGNACIRWVSIDSAKRAIETGAVGPSIVVHTSVPFGIHNIDKDQTEIQPIILQHLDDVIPNLPKAASIKCQKWRYSQVSKPMEGSPGHVTIAEQPSYLLLAAGDGFAHSTLDGCIDSAESAVHRLMQFFRTTSQL